MFTPKSPLASISNSIRYLHLRSRKISVPLVLIVILRVLTILDDITK
jgi:hypothetical protein